MDITLSLASLNNLTLLLDPSGENHRKFREVEAFVSIIFKNPIPEGLHILATEESYFNDHGIGHIERVGGKIDEIRSYLYEELNEKEVFCLLCGLFCHDLSMAIGHNPERTYDDTREEHHELSADLVHELNDRGVIHLESLELSTIQEIIRAHRRIDISTIPDSQWLDGFEIRTRLLGSILRLADALDCDRLRTPKSIFDYYYDSIPEDSKEHWTNLLPISNVHIDESKSSVIISADISGTVDEIIKKYRSANLIKKELLKEIQSINGILSLHNIPVSNVLIQNYHTGEIEDFTMVWGVNEYILINLVSNFDEYEELVKVLSDFNDNAGNVPILLLINPPEGTLIIKCQIKIDITKYEELSETLNDSIDSNFLLNYIGYPEATRKESWGS